MGQAGREGEGRNLTLQDAMSIEIIAWFLSCLADWPCDSAAGTC